jgi:hypothetical protein
MKKGSGSVNMQLIRAINKSNKSNNNNNINNNNGSANQTSSTSNNNTTSTNKVVIVTPPTHQQQQQSAASASAALQVSQNANGSNSSSSVAPVSPSASLPPLKKRTTIVKQAVPPPPPPRKSSPAPPARSKSNLPPYCTSRIIVDVDRLHSLTQMGMPSGNLKVKKWLESVELPPLIDDEILIRDEVTFKSVRKLVESFSIKALAEEEVKKGAKKVRKRNVKISDSSVVKARIEGYNTLERKARNQSSALKCETDSGIEISSKSTSMLKFRHQFSRDGEFV